MNIVDNIEPIFYKDYELCLNFLDTVDFNIKRNNVCNYHTYSEIKTEKELMVVKSFLATQNLETSKFILWSDYDISDNKLIQPYKNYIELRVFNPEEESKGTCLENKKQHLSSNDNLYWLKSDLFRILATYKYGGVFTDMDFIYLNNFSPILDLEFTYQWGSELDFAGFGSCGTVMKLDKKSDLAEMMLQELCNSHISPNTTIWGKDLFAKVYRKNKFTILPSTFFNTEWMINKKYPGKGDSTEHGWFNKNKHSTDLFLNTFGWHWHNSSHKTKIVNEGSKFDLLTKYIDNKLRDKGII
jgi:hypothetical protein